MSKLIVDGNEVFPGTITIIDNNSTITPKDNLRVILNISGESTVTLSDGTDVTQRVEVFNASNDNCTLSYVSSAGNSTTVLAKNTSIRLLWVGTFWDYSDATTVTGIDDNGQPFAYNIDSLVEPKGVINITGKDANGNSFDYGLGKLVLAADEDNYSTEEVKTSKTWIDGKPIYRRVITGTTGTLTNNTENTISINFNFETPLNFFGVIQSGPTTWNTFPYSYTTPVTIGGVVYGVIGQAIMAYFSTNTLNFVIYCSNNSATYSNRKYNIVVEYTKTTD